MSLAQTKIYKYRLARVGVTEVEVPVGAEFLSIKRQRDDVVAYFAVPVDETANNTHLFRGVLTGACSGVPVFAKYLDTLMFDADAFVVHYFHENQS